MEALTFLIQIRDKIGNFNEDRNFSISSYFSGDTPVEEKKLSNSGGKKAKSYKYENIGREELFGVLDDDQQDINVQGDQKTKEKSEAVLKASGISDFLEGVPDKLKASRMLYGFLGKPNRSTLKIEKKRWVFLISSRPLQKEAYLEDVGEIDEDELPPILNFDTIYYYKTNYPDDSVTLAGEIKTIDIDNIQKSEDDGKLHSFTIEAKSKSYQFVSNKRFIMEQWVEAITLSIKTAKEKQYSITGKIKNISMIVTNFEIDKDMVREEIEKDIDNQLWNEEMTDYKEYEEVYLTLEAIDVIKEDMIYTFDACLAQNPPRKDIIQMYMETVHLKMCERLTHEWNIKALLMTPLDILSVCEWVHKYMTTLKRFGIKDDSLENGYLTLVNAYKRKIHMQIYPMITNVLIREREGHIESSPDGKLYTHSPNDIFKIFLEVFEVLSNSPMKELILGVLEILHEIFSQYQRALYQMISMDTSLSFDYLVAINNNFSKFFDFTESLLGSCKENKELEEEEYNTSFDQRTISQYFSKITTKIVGRITDETWTEVREYFTGNYLDLDLEGSLNHAFMIFEEKVELMTKQTSREVWKAYLHKTIVAMVQILFNSITKMKKGKSEDAIVKIQKDYEKVKEMFSEYMSERMIRPALEVLGDIKNFFESSVDFLPISVGKMRKDHGPAFNITTVKALLSLRTDLSKDEKNQVLKDSTEVLNQYKDEGVISNKGVFNNVDTASAVEEFNDEMRDPEEEKEEAPQEEEEEELDLDDFLKQGGIDVEELDEKIDETVVEKEKEKKLKLKRTQTLKEIVGREDMSGWLFKSNDSLKKRGIFDTVLNTVTDTIELVADNIDKKRSKRYFRIKKGFLYWYTKEDSDKAQNDLDIKKIEHLEMNKDNDKMILIMIKEKIYKLEHSNKDYIEEWYKSLCLVRSKSEEYLNLDRYVDSKVFERVTGKNIFTDYEEILGKHFKEIEDEEQKKEAEEKRIRDEEIQRELQQEIEAKSKKKKKGKGKDKEQKEEGAMFQKEDALSHNQAKDESEAANEDFSSAMRGESEIRLDDDHSPEGMQAPQLNPGRSTVVENTDRNTFSESEGLSSLKLYKSNTTTDFDRFSNSSFKILETMGNEEAKKEVMEVYKKHKNVKKADMFKLVVEHESMLSDEGSGGSSETPSTKRSAKKTPEGNSHL